MSPYLVTHKWLKREKNRKTWLADENFRTYFFKNFGSAWAVIMMTPCFAPFFQISRSNPDNE